MKLSIITVNLNNCDGLKKTAESVISQSNTDYEWIVMDGGSTDGSVDIIKEYVIKADSKGIRNTWVSESDTGIYNAMNKGVRASSGEYLLFLNSGDYFVDSKVVASIIPCLDGTDIVQGNTESLIDGQLQIDRGCGRSNVDYIDVQKGRFLHQASFCKKSLFEQYGYYDESYRIDGDTVFFIRCLGKGNASFKYVDQTISFFDGGGLSDNANERWAQQRAQEFARWSSEEFSKRQWDTCVEYDKKGRLYDKLHRHKWSWYVAMVMVKMIDKLER